MKQQVFKEMKTMKISQWRLVYNISFKMRQISPHKKKTTWCIHKARGNSLYQSSTSRLPGLELTSYGTCSLNNEWPLRLLLDHLKNLFFDDKRNLACLLPTIQSIEIMMWYHWTIFFEVVRSCPSKGGDKVPIQWIPLSSTVKVVAGD